MGASTTARLLLNPNPSPNKLLPPSVVVRQMTFQEASVISLQGEGIPMSTAPVAVGIEEAGAWIYRRYVVAGLDADRLKIS